MAAPTKEIRTFVSLTRPFDPAYIRTLADLNMSYALSSTLVTWSSDRQPVSALAKSWKIDGEKTITFEISPEAKWSDGKRITAEEFKASLDRAKLLHGDALKSLFDVVEKIETPSSETLRFVLTLPVDKSQILKKLTEPMYGAVKVKGGQLDLSVSSGPFYLKSDADAETVLSKNPYWIKATSKLADTVIIRPVPQDKSIAESFLKGDWANLVETSSLVSDEISGAIKSSGVGIWSHNLDKAFVIGLSPKHFNEHGFQFVRYLGQHLQKQSLLNGLTGANKADQFFPKGYALYSPEFTLTKDKQVVPKEFASRPLVVLIARERVNSQLQKNLSEALGQTLKNEIQFKTVSISDMEKARKEGAYDVYAVSLAVTDPNYEGSMAFWFDTNPAFIPSGKGHSNFQTRVAKIRQLNNVEEKVIEARKIMTESVQHGSILPLFHFSTVGLAKPGINLGAVPTTDETISFEKVTFE